MHEIERHRIILTEVDEKPIVTLGYLVDLLGVSEATVRRDISQLHKQATFFMAEHLKTKKLNILTNSFVMAEHLLKHSKNTVTVPGGTVYQEQNIILSPFPNDVSSHFFATYLFLGAQGVGPQGVLEADPLIVQAEMKLINQAEKRVLLVDSSKFSNRSNLILCPLSLIDYVITDDGIDAKSRKMIEEAGCQLIVVSMTNQATMPETIP